MVISDLRKEPKDYISKRQCGVHIQQSVLKSRSL